MQKKTTFQIAFTIILAYSALKTIGPLQEQGPWFSIELLIPVMLIITTLWLYGKAFGKVIISDKLLSVLLGVLGAAYLIHDIVNLI
jgi:hypothetical protein